MLLQKHILLYCNLRSGALERAADLDQPVVAQKTLDFAEDKRDGVGGKARILGKIKVPRGFKHSDGPELDEVLVIRAAAGEAQRERLDQSHIRPQQLVERLIVPALHALEQRDVVVCVVHGDSLM